MDNGVGLRLKAITHGGFVIALQVPDARSALATMVLDFDNLTDFVWRNPHFGIIVSRYPKPIDGAKGFGPQLRAAEIAGDGLSNRPRSWLRSAECPRPEPPR